MAWRLPGDKPLSEAVMVSLLTHICVTRPQWVKNQVRIHEIYWHLMWGGIGTDAGISPSANRMGKLLICTLKNLVRIPTPGAHIYITHLMENFNGRDDMDVSWKLILRYWPDSDSHTFICYIPDIQHRSIHSFPMPLWLAWVNCSPSIDK